MKIAEFIKNKANAISGIYAIICSKTWRSYIGSSCNIKKRLEVHYQQLKKGNHDNAARCTKISWEIVYSIR